jgi:hypothetical protein
VGRGVLSGLSLRKSPFSFLREKIIKKHLSFRWVELPFFIAEFGNAQYELSKVGWAHQVASPFLGDDFLPG